ncbi:MAG: leucine-rich repeat domain-containing protein, partial [Bacteroidota bacterium]
MRPFYRLSFLISFLFFCHTLPIQAHANPALGLPAEAAAREEAKDIFGSPPDPRTVPESDSLALVALYNSTNGANWKTKTNWLTGKVNTWYGVTVDDGRVKGLNLASNQLIGSLPVSLGNLSALTSLNLEWNKLSGSIPASLGNLTALNFLYMYGNELSGNIPATLGNLPVLIVLYLSSNELSGSIPVELSKLTALQRLYLSSNELSGSIPVELGNLTALQQLDLRGNQLSGSIPT